MKNGMTAIDPMVTHEHFCPVCKRKWEHENRSRITCYAKEERCWTCRLKAWYGGAHGDNDEVR